VPEGASTAIPDDARPRLTAPERLKFTLASLLAATLIRIIGLTLRMTISYEEGSIRGLEDIRPGIFPFWHRCVFASAWLFRNRGIGVLTSLSRDGEYIARVIQRLGFVAVRGSSSRGGWRGLLEMQQMVEAGETVAFTIDGPRGPRYVAKPGAVILARRTGRPVSCFHIGVQYGFTLEKAWDHFQIPFPFSSVVMFCAPPIRVPADAASDVMKAKQDEVQEALERCREVAQSWFDLTESKRETIRDEWREK